jgi:rRNA maturation protein Nop10
MKRCPTCNQTYTDEALSFCPNDGTPLMSSAPSSYNPQATIMAPPPSVTQNPSDPFGAPAQSDWGATPGAWTPPPAPAPMPGMGYPGIQGQEKGLATAALICGILSLVCFTLLGPVAIVLGIMALNKAKNDPARYGAGRGMAIGGIATGSVATFLFFLVILLFLGGLLTR